MLEYTILLLTYAGLWQPTYWIPGSWKTYLYKIYTYSVLSIVYAETLSELLYLATSTHGIADIMITLLGKEPYPSKIDSKNIILNKYNNIINKRSLAYIIMNQMTMIIMIVTFSIKNISNRVLIANCWIPYDHTTTIGFWFTYIFQCIARAYQSLIATAFDTLVPSMMYQICYQCSILQCRFETMPDVIRNIKKYNKKNSIILETMKLGECVRHHIQIYQLSIILIIWAERCNNIFSGIIFLQYSISSIVLCVSVVLLTQIEYNDPIFASTILYLVCMFFQIFILCYSGNQVTIESMNVGDMVYCMDWTQFELSTKKNLMMIMKRTMHPVVFTSGYFVTLSIGSFTDLIKLSYSAFNLLNRSSG
ncbi:odorant receptor 4-like [Aphidius gifuensis]|uniref:odorant receptor 4-like n=1 Tax=Aphidius gifuensis TaxID=684658 RepID=UPI001CDCAE9A|nr:odorant receptor 4-like [Aphidius gifuensis]